MKANVQKKRKYNPKNKKIYKKKDYSRPYAPDVSKKEYKYVDNLLISDVFNNVQLGGTINWLNNTAVGTWPVNRIGNKIIMKSLHFRALITAAPEPPSYPSFSTVLRFVLVYDKFHNNSIGAPSLTTVFNALNYTGVEETSVLTGVNISNRDRFIILRDYIRQTPRITYETDNLTPKRYDYTNFGGTANGSEKTGSNFLIDDFIKINLPVVYKTNSTVQQPGLADINVGALFLYSFCGSQPGLWYINHSSRLVFKEEKN